MPLREDILNPISGDNPCGDDLRYAPVYDQIKEARREEDDVAQGVWQRARKVADWGQVVKLASEAIAKKSKDLQLAAWLTEGLVYRDGFVGLRDGLGLIRSLLDQYWDNLYPELEDGDSEMRSVPLSYIVGKVDVAMRKVPLTPAGVSWTEYKDSLTIPSEEEASSNGQKREARADAENAGKVMPEEVDSALKATPSTHFDELGETLTSIRDELDTLDSLCNEKFDDYAPNLSPLKECLEQIENTVRIMSQRRSGPPATDASSSRAKSTTQVAAAAPKKASSDWDEWDEVDVTPSDEAQPESSGFDDTPEQALAYDPFADDEAGHTPAPAIETASAPAHDDDWDDEPVAASAPVQQRSGGSVSAEPQDAEDAVSRICTAALWLRNQNPKAPAPYLLLRALRFGELRASGESPEWSILEAAPIEVRQRLKLHSMEQNWEVLLTACEEAMALPCGRAWLDLQRYTVQALEGLGEEYASVLEAVREELRGLLMDFPSLPELTLNDDTPTANAQTLQFLREEGLLGGASAPRPKEPARAQSEDDLLREAIKSRKYEVALGILARMVKSETTGRGRFERKVQQASILMEAGRKVVAYPILRELSAEIFERRLDEWEASPLVVEPLMLLYQCLNDEGDEAAEKQKIYQMICRLDPVRAFELN